jgi:hypothetical protein
VETTREIKGFIAFIDERRVCGGNQ